MPLSKPIGRRVFLRQSANLLEFTGLLLTSYNGSQQRLNLYAAAKDTCREDDED